MVCKLLRTEVTGPEAEKALVLGRKEDRMASTHNQLPCTFPEYIAWRQEIPFSLLWPESMAKPGQQLPGLQDPATHTPAPTELLLGIL